MVSRSRTPTLLLHFPFPRVVQENPDNKQERRESEVGVNAPAAAAAAAAVAAQGAGVEHLSDPYRFFLSLCVYVYLYVGDGAESSLRPL